MPFPLAHPAAPLPAGARMALLAGLAFTLLAITCKVLIERAPAEISLLTLRSLLGHLVIALGSVLGLGLMALGLARRLGALPGHRSAEPGTRSVS